MSKVYAVGVGPGSPKYVTRIVKEIIQNCDVIIGYKYTLKTIEDLIVGKEVYEITMNNQEDSYQKILPELDDRTLVIPFTGDVNFSESEVVDRLLELFGDDNVEQIHHVIMGACFKRVRKGKLTPEQIVLALRLVDEGQSVPQVAETFGVHETMIYRCLSAAEAAA